MNKEYFVVFFSALFVPSIFILTKKAYTPLTLLGKCRVDVRLDKEIFVVKPDIYTVTIVLSERLESGLYSHAVPTNSHILICMSTEMLTLVIF